MLHGFQTLRPGQLRGVTPFAPAILMARDMGDYTTAELGAAKMAAKWLGFVRSQDPGFSQLTRGLGDPAACLRDEVENLEDLTIEYLNNNEDVSFAPPSQRPGDSFDRFVRHTLRMVAICLDLPYEILSGDYTSINYSTSKASRNDFAMFGEVRPRYAIIENVRGVLSRGMEIVLRDLASLGYDAEWEVLSAAALGAPHRRERVFIVAFPHGEGPDPEHRLLSPLQRIVGKVDQPCVVLDWRGIRIVGQSREAFRRAYPGPVLYQVDDGRAGRMDHPVNVPSVPRRVLPEWHRRLKVLGNGVLPQQAYAVGACIMAHEGRRVSPMPLTPENRAFQR